MELVQGMCQSMGHQGQGLPILAEADLALSQDLQDRKDTVGEDEVMIVCRLLLISKNFPHTNEAIPGF